jgi:hypothetical protein
MNATTATAPAAISYLGGLNVIVIRFQRARFVSITQSSPGGHCSSGAFHQLW